MVNFKFIVHLKQRNYRTQPQKLQRFEAKKIIISCLINIRYYENYQASLNYAVRLLAILKIQMITNKHKAHLINTVCLHSPRSKSSNQNLPAQSKLKLYQKNVLEDSKTILFFHKDSQFFTT